jgi:hypothetical protein
MEHQTMFSSLRNGIQEFRASRIGFRAQEALQAGNFDECIALNLKALKMMEQIFGDIAQTIVYAWDLAEAYALYGRFEDAALYYRRVLEFVESNPSSDLADAIGLPIVASKLSEVLHEQGRDEEAEKLNEKLELIASTSEESLINTQEDLDYFVQYYYQHKHPALVSSAMSFLDKESEIPVETLMGGVTGFYGEVFRQNLDYLDKWIIEIDESSERGKQLFLNALWLSNTQKAKEYLHQKATEETGDVRISIDKFIESEPPDLKKLIPSNPAENDMLWGAFLAIGDPIYITNIIEAATEYNNRVDYLLFMVAATAKWSLVSNAQQHEIVHQTLENELDRFKGHKINIIQDILDKSQQPNGPNMVGEDIQQVLEEQKNNGIWLEYMENQ